MAYYGIPSAGIALSAAASNDVIGMLGVGGTVLTGQTLQGGQGNDYINFGSLGSVATYSGELGIAGSGATTFSGTQQINGGPTFEFISGNAGSGTFSFSGVTTNIVTSTQAGISISNIVAGAGKGNDAIIFDPGATGAISTSTLNGGVGNDFIGFASDANGDGTGLVTAAAVSFAMDAVEINGGDGRDTINLAGGVSLSAVTIAAQQDQDLVQFVSGLVTGSTIGLGAGADTLNATGASTFAASTIFGAKGNDTILIEGILSTGVQIYGDSELNGSLSTDGNDSISYSGVAVDATIVGGGGNDILTLTGASFGSASFAAMNAGNDTINIGLGTDLGALTAGIGFGKNADTFNVASGGSISGTTITMGKGLDIVNIGTNIYQSGGVVPGPSTIIGGLGNDIIRASASGGATPAFSGARVSLVNYGYVSAGESTLTAFDTISVGGGAGFSGGWAFDYQPGGVFGGAGTVAGAFTATNGIAVFTGTFSNDLTARVDSLDSNLPNNAAVGFTDGSRQAYLFVQGGSTDLLVRVGAGVLGSQLSGATMAFANGGRSITFNVSE